MKRMWDIADHGGKHDDPVSGPPTIRVHSLEEAGRTVRGNELIPEARTPKKNLKGGSDPGLCGRLAATSPLRSYRHFGDRSRP